MGRFLTQLVNYPHDVRWVGASLGWSFTSQGVAWADGGEGSGGSRWVGVLLGCSITSQEWGWIGVSLGRSVTCRVDRHAARRLSSF